MGTKLLGFSIGRGSGALKGLRPLLDQERIRSKIRLLPDAKLHSFVGLGTRRELHANNKMAHFRRFWVNPFRVPEPLPILNPSNFVPKNGFPVVKGLRCPVIRKTFRMKKNATCCRSSSLHHTTTTTTTTPTPQPATLTHPQARLKELQTSNVDTLSALCTRTYSPL